MGVEIERKFLVDNEQWDKAAKSEGVRYQQGYMVNDERRTIRVRLSDKTGYINLKGPAQGISRPEFEYEIPLQDGMELMRDFTVSQVEKTRFCVDYAGKTWEVDVFHGDNTGLITAEIELDAENEQFDLPPWIVKEVSDDNRYSNASLSKHPFRTW